MVTCIGDIQGCTIDQHGLGAGELSIAVAELSKLEEIFEILVENLDAVVIAEFADENAAFRVEGDVAGVDKLAGIAAEAAKLLEQFALGAVDDDAGVVRI